MKAYLIRPHTLFFKDKIYKIEPTNGFGGFCSCGGFMNQIGWVDEWLMVAECENCWKIEAFIYENFNFVKRFEVEVLSLPELLKIVLTEDEFNSLLNKAKGLDYDQDSFSMARKKLENMNFDVDGLLKELGRADFSE